MAEPRIQIAGRPIGKGHPAYIVAEVSANHNQNIERAKEIIRAAKDAGADAIKLQTYTADTLTIDSDEPWFRIDSGSLWSGKTLYELYQEAFTPWEWHQELFGFARSIGLQAFSTPFDASAVDFLEELDVPAHKIASFEIIDVPLLRKIAATKKPVIASTGMASLEEIAEAVKVLTENGTTELVLLKCTSAYPAIPEDMNLRSIPYLASRFGVEAGLSDHTMGSSVAVAAVALGAVAVEKHLTLKRSDGGPDSAFSMEPDEFARMVQDIRNVEAALGGVSFTRTAAEEKNLVFRRSLFVVRDLRKGEAFTADAVRSIRPGHGLHPRHLDDVIGKRAACDIRRGTPMKWEFIEKAGT